jgi:hypothetical protein
LFTSGIIAVLASMIMSSFINERAFRVLSAEQKVRLMDGFSNYRKLAMIPLTILIAAFYLLATQTTIDRQSLFVAYFASLTIYVICSNITIHRKMKSLQMPSEYVYYFSIGQIVSVAGTGWFFYVVLETQTSSVT